MGRAIELSLLAIIVIVIAFVVIPKIMLEFGKQKQSEDAKVTPLRKVDSSKSEDE